MRVCIRLRVAGEEARHFTTWRDRLVELGSHYGAIPVHEALWGSAFDTRNDLYARLAIVHMVHEARGLGRLTQHNIGHRIASCLINHVDIVSRCHCLY
jgi:uncharacterized ferritin-like protein (DUF455 family)